MHAIYYKKRRCGIECTAVYSRKNSSRIELRFDFDTCGSVSLFGTRKKIENRICEFALKDVPDGVYTPIFKEGSVETKIESFELKRGDVLFVAKSDAFVRGLSEEIEKLYERLKKTESTLKEHDKKINGTPIF